MRDNVIKLAHTRIKKSIDEKSLLEAYEEVKEYADGFILIYRNKIDKNHCILTDGFNCAEGVFAAEILRDASLYGNNEGYFKGEEE